MILFSQEPYTSQLRIHCKSGSLDFSYGMVWKKDHFQNALIAKKALVPIYEDISLFDKKYDDENVNPLRDYSRRLFEYIDKPKSEIMKLMGNGKADHFFRFGSMQFSLCTRETYDHLTKTFNLIEFPQFLPFEDLAKLNSKFESVFNLEGLGHKANLLEYSKEYGERFHPTQKPIALMEYLIRTFTNEGDTVLDFTMGSGSTGVAAKQLNRKFIGIELDEDYFKIASERIEKAIRGSSLESKTFEDSEFIESSSDW